MGFGGGKVRGLWVGRVGLGGGVGGGGGVWEGLEDNGRDLGMWFCLGGGGGVFVGGIV